MSRKMHWPGVESGRRAGMFRAVGILGFISLALVLLLAFNPIGQAEAKDNINGCIDISPGKKGDIKSFTVSVNEKCGDFGPFNFPHDDDDDDSDDDGPSCNHQGCPDDDDDDDDCKWNCDDDDDGPDCNHQGCPDDDDDDDCHQDCGDDDDDNEGPDCNHQGCPDDDDDDHHCDDGHNHDDCDDDDDDKCDGRNEPWWCDKDKDDCDLDDALHNLPSNVEIVSIDSDSCTVIVKQKAPTPPPAPIIINNNIAAPPSQQPIIIQQAAPAPTAVAAAVGGQTIAPPKTGDAGLASSNASTLPFAGLAVVLGFIGLSAASFAYSKRAR